MVDAGRLVRIVASAQNPSTEVLAVPELHRTEGERRWVRLPGDFPEFDRPAIAAAELLYAGWLDPTRRLFDKRPGHR